MPDVPRDEPEDARPWERPGAVRRDCARHRGKLLHWLGRVALCCGLVSFLGFPALVAVPLGLATWRMTRHDLREMAAGRMDPAGRGLTARGYVLGLGAVVASLVTLAGGAAFVELIRLSAS